MAMVFPFELDPFQDEAISYLEKGESVFVAAHTSAGKTVVAEYAFALALKNSTRAIYTAPIKTISNQKYRDFCGKFDVGILTGDIKLKPDAPCLIMTTEILRSMLYNNEDIIRQIEWVIFDEVHYINDEDRGVVWEEVIIMLPKHIKIVLLSATVPNAAEFAKWISQIKQMKIHVIRTTKRPVPLEHHLFYSGELYNVCKNEVFLSRGFIAAKNDFKRKSQNQECENPNMSEQATHSGSHELDLCEGGNKKNRALRRTEATFWLSLITLLSEKSLLPVIIFCFSKDRCDQSANNLITTDLTSSSEKIEIQIFCEKAFSRLKESDRNLPQILRVQNLLHKGIAIHHSGLLPIVKEVVEILFCRGVIKVLFSTETFAMGVNAPAKTVVFDGLSKFDGNKFRQLLPGEYTQMAGRAGRRGIDKIGTVIVMCQGEIPKYRDLEHVIVGSATKLESHFKVSYKMILQLFHRNELKVEDMLKNSFAQFQAKKKLTELEEQLLMMKHAEPIKSIECMLCEASIFEEYFDLYWEAERYSKQMSEAIMQSSDAQQFLITGRVVLVQSQAGKDHLLGVVVKGPSGGHTGRYVVLVLKPDIPASSFGSGTTPHNKNTELPDGVFMPPKKKRQVDHVFTPRKATGAFHIRIPHHGAAAGSSYEVKSIDRSKIVSICSCEIQIDHVELLIDVKEAAYSKTVQQLTELKSKWNKYLPVLDPVKDLKLEDMDVEDYNKWINLVKKMAKSKCHGCFKLDEHLKLGKEIRRHKEEVDALEFQLSETAALQQMTDFQSRIDILKELDYIDKDLVEVKIKGKVACGFNFCDELICTECLFDDKLMKDLEPEEAVALMSALVYQQGTPSKVKSSLTPKLGAAIQRLHDTAIRLGSIHAKSKLQIAPKIKYAKDNLNFGLVKAVYEWAKGTSFSDICKLTDVSEGLILRTIVRLDEVCHEFGIAAATKGNFALQNKIEKASKLIKRDIVLADSLYITEA